MKIWKFEDKLGFDNRFGSHTHVNHTPTRKSHTKDLMNDKSYALSNKIFLKLLSNQNKILQAIHVNSLHASRVQNQLTHNQIKYVRILIKSLNKSLINFGFYCLHQFSPILKHSPPGMSTIL